MFEAEVSVHGLGTVGLPLAAVLARQLRVHGVEISAEQRAAVVDPSTTFSEPGLQRAVREALDSGRLRVEQAPGPAPIHLLCLPTPLVDRRADLSCLEAAVDALAPFLRAGDLVAVESTIPPGTVELLAARVGREDVLWAAAPERLLPGRALAELVSVDRVVGGTTAAATAMAAAFYERFLGVAVHRTDAQTATVAKLTENTARDVQIALANQLAALARGAGVDPLAALELARSHPRVDLLEPGIGVGGHCLPVDPWFLAQIAPGRAPLIEAARRVNRQAEEEVLAAIREAADLLEDPSIACLGAAYKPGSGDTRDSPALRIARQLQVEGRRVGVVDPWVAPVSDLRWWTVEEAAERADLAVLLVDHPGLRAAWSGPLLDLCRGPR